MFRAQNLTWTAAQAVRVLAEVEPDEVRPPRVTASLPWFEAVGAAAGAAELPKLPPRKPKVEQLSLFD